MHEANTTEAAGQSSGVRMTEKPQGLDLVWGIRSIAAYIGRTPRQAYEALSKGELPARQVNKRWVASKRKLREHFEGEAA